MTTLDTAPREVHLLPSGTFIGRDGRGPYLNADSRAIIQASFAHRGMIPIGYDNQLCDPRTTAKAQIAGWISRMEARPDGIWVA